MIPAAARLLVATALLGALGLLPAPAAATAYRYWTYWTSAGSTWTFSQTGPASAVPKHGAVEGWRFAMSTGTRGQGSQPRIAPAPAFQQFCGAAAAPAGQKRVAVVFDFGVASDAPDGATPPQARGTCVEIDRGATGGEILARAADVRIEGGLVCAIGGYPKGECAPAVSTPEPKPDSDDGVDRRPDRPDDPAETGDRDRPAANPDPDPPSDTSDDDTRPDSDDSGAPPPAASPSPTPKRSPAPETRPSRPSLPAVPAAPSASASASPLFVAAEARTEEPDAAPRWGLAAAVLALGGLGAYLVLRRRPRR